MTQQSRIDAAGQRGIVDMFHQAAFHRRPDGVVYRLRVTWMMIHVWNGVCVVHVTGTGVPAAG